MNKETNIFPGAGYDNKIFTKFSKKTIKKKQENKEKFCEEFGILFDPRKILISVVSEISEKNNADILTKILPGLENLPVLLAIRAIGSEKFKKIITNFADQSSKNVTIVSDSNENLRKIFAASDSVLFFSDSLEDHDLAKIALSYAALPICSENFDFVEDYNPNLESGIGFTFVPKNYWSVFIAIVRAVENFRFPFDFVNIQRNALEN